METFNSFEAATQAAKQHFLEHFGHTQGVGVESATGYVVEFFSKQDPSMVDTFFCRVEDGWERDCINGGDLRKFKIF